MVFQVALAKWAFSAQWVKISSVYGPCLRESPNDWLLHRGHTTFPEPMSWLSSLQLTLHPLPHQFPQSFSIYRATGGLGCVAQMFSPSHYITFQVSSQSRCSHSSTPCPGPQMLKPSSAPESTSGCCCVFDQESYEQEQENPTLKTVWQASSWVCVCSSSLCSQYSCEQMFSTGQLAVLSLAPHTNASVRSPALDWSQFAQDSSIFLCLDATLFFTSHRALLARPVKSLSKGVCSYT